MPGQFCIPASHPCLPGHFPGRPVVPGVVLLDAVLQCLPAGAALTVAKFTAPVLPGQPVAWASRTEGRRIAFECQVGGQTVLHGTALLP